MQASAVRVNLVATLEIGDFNALRAEFGGARAGRVDDREPATAFTQCAQLAGEIGGSGLSDVRSPSIASIGANCGKATKPPAGIQPKPYCTPLMVFDQIGLPNHTWNLSICKPRQRAARKCPNS